MYVSVCVLCVYMRGVNRDMAVTGMITEDRDLRMKQMWGKGGGFELIRAWVCRPDDGKE